MADFVVNTIQRSYDNQLAAPRAVVFGLGFVCGHLFWPQRGMK